VLELEREEEVLEAAGSKERPMDASRDGGQESVGAALVWCGMGASRRVVLVLAILSVGAREALSKSWDGVCADPELVVRRWMMGRDGGATCGCGGGGGLVAMNGCNDDG
jgi:hypothetical protein